MKRLLLCLLLAAGCETKAAELAPGFVYLEDLDQANAAAVMTMIAQLPIEYDDLPRLEYMPRTLAEARRAIESSGQGRIPELAGACLTNDWVLFSPAAAAQGMRFERGWALRRTTMRLFLFDSRHQASDGR